MLSFLYKTVKSILAKVKMEMFRLRRGNVVVTENDIRRCVSITGYLLIFVTHLLASIVLVADIKTFTFVSGSRGAVLAGICDRISINADFLNISFIGSNIGFLVFFCSFCSTFRFLLHNGI